jgi:flavin reductase (DIM6/NTAB) family NADH-FMN oxidoreductase RutF
MPDPRSQSAAPTTSPHAAHPPLEARHLRDCLGHFATGVTIVTACAPDGTLAGLTVNSFNSLSLDPPLVLWSLSLRSTSLSTFEAASHFAVSVLSSGQLDLARRFARAQANRFAGLTVRTGLGGAPLIDGAVAWFECECRSHQRAGDHVLFIGQVRRCARDAGGQPLVFHKGHFLASVRHPDESR